MRKDGWDLWGNEIPGFKDFWSFLKGLAEAESRCSCREGTCGPPFCGIRKCARKKGIEICAFCGDYPCHRIQGLAKGYITMPADSQRMKEIGVEAWIQEQEERRKTVTVHGILLEYWPFAGFCGDPRDASNGFPAVLRPGVARFEFHREPMSRWIAA
jgi:hypothetical protein